MVHSQIQVVRYNPEWAEEFEEERNRLSSLLGAEAAAVEHVGSTSVPGQEAKPIIDIFVGVRPFREWAFYQSLLGSKVYEYVPTGMNGRYLFNKYTDGTWTHNIHVLPYDEEFYLRNEILLRDYLRRHPELVREYGEVKKASALRFGTELEAYTKSKTGFIQKVIDAARAEKGLPLEDVWTNELK